MVPLQNNYYSLPYHGEAGEVLEELGFTWTEDSVDDNRDIDSFIINGFERTFSLFDGKSFSHEKERLESLQNETIIPVTFKDIQLWQK